MILMSTIAIWNKVHPINEGESHNRINNQIEFPAHWPLSLTHLSIKLYEIKPETFFD